MRYNKHELRILTWGKVHNYPQLLLSDADVLRHGEFNWHLMARNRERRLLAWKRIEMWQEYSQRAS